MDFDSKALDVFHKFSNILISGRSCLFGSLLDDDFTTLSWRNRRWRRWWKRWILHILINNHGRIWTSLLLLWKVAWIHTLSFFDLDIRNLHLCKSIHSPLAGPSGEVEGQSERESKRGVNSQETERERHEDSAGTVQYCTSATVAMAWWLPYMRQILLP